MEHIIITELANGLFRLTPEAGWALVDKRTKKTYSEAEVPEKAQRYFAAVKIAEPSDDDLIGAAEALRIITGK